MTASPIGFPHCGCSLLVVCRCDCHCRGFGRDFAVTSVAVVNWFLAAVVVAVEVVDGT